MELDKQHAQIETITALFYIQFVFFVLVDELYLEHRIYLHKRRGEKKKCSRSFSTSLDKLCFHPRCTYFSFGHGTQLSLHVSV